MNPGMTSLGGRQWQHHLDGMRAVDIGLDFLDAANENADGLLPHEVTPLAEVIVWERVRARLDGLSRVEIDRRYPLIDEAADEAWAA